MFNGSMFNPADQPKQYVKVKLKCQIYARSWTNLMGNHGDAGVVQVEPGGDLPVGHDKDMSDPRGVSFHRAQRIAQLLVVLEAAGRHVLILLRLEHKHPHAISWLQSIIILPHYLKEPLGNDNNPRCYRCSHYEIVNCGHKGLHVVSNDTQLDCTNQLIKQEQRPAGNHATASQESIWVSASTRTQNM